MWVITSAFAWYIAKFLQAAGARLIFAVHPRMTSIVQSILDRAADAEYRVLPYGAGELKVEKVIPCDVSYDTMADVPEAVRNDRRYTRLNSDYSIAGMIETVKSLCGSVDILIHSVAFSPEITQFRAEHEPGRLHDGIEH